MLWRERLGPAARGLPLAARRNAAWLGSGLRAGRRPSAVHRLAQLGRCGVPSAVRACLPAGRGLPCRRGWRQVACTRRGPEAVGGGGSVGGAGAGGEGLSAAATAHGCRWCAQRRSAPHARSWRTLPQRQRVHEVRSCAAVSLRKPPTALLTSGKSEGGGRKRGRGMHGEKWGIGRRRAAWEGCPARLERCPEPGAAAL